ncbi:MAG: type ISP restriction/modification enzyme [Patescibacteria group bacterium]
MSIKNTKKIKYADLWGLRKEKYDWLDNHDFSDTKWQELDPKSPYYFFVPKDDAGWEQYQNFWKITDIFPVNSVGIVTARDDLTIGWTENEIWNRVLTFANYEPEQARAFYQLGKDARDWKVELAQKDLHDSGLKRELVVPIAYRPFDIRYTYYTGHSRGFHCMPRPEVMRNMIKPNLALNIGRSGIVANVDGWDVVFVTDSIPDLNLFRRGGNQVLPLYSYSRDDEQQGLFQQISHATNPNLNPEIWDYLGDQYVATHPEDIFNYIYAVLYSNTYRQKYAEFLKVDFPRIPFTQNYQLFQKLAELGRGLVDLHLLRSPELDNPGTKCHGTGSNLVGIAKFIGIDEAVEYHDIQIETFWPESGEKPKYKSAGIVMLNDEKQFFGPVPREVWDYHIGGYQVLHKWLKDRKGRYLANEEIKTYCRIATALKSTIEIQKEIDNLYPKVEESLINNA